MKEGKNSPGYKKATSSAWISVGVNFALFIIKFGAALAGKSTALMADALHTASDVFSTFLVLWGLKTASQPADKSHPYGHGKAESIAARLVAGILFVVGLGIGKDAYQKIFFGTVLSAPAKFTLGAALLSIIVKEGLYQYRIRVGRKTGSLSTVADAWHHRSDAFSSIPVSLGIAGAIFGGSRWYVLDPLAAIVVAVIIVRVGAHIWVQSTRELMDEMLSAELIEKIRQSAHKVEGVMGTEKIFGRKSGLDILVDIHVEVDRRMSVKESHGVSQKVRDAIINDMPSVKSVLVHIEPYYRHSHSDEEK